MRLSWFAALLAAVTLAGCASGPETVVKLKGEPATVLNPGSLTVATNGAMPALRVEAFRSEERKP